MHVHNLTRSKLKKDNEDESTQTKGDNSRKYLASHSHCRIYYLNESWPITTTILNQFRASLANKVCNRIFFIVYYEATRVQNAESPNILADMTMTGHH